MLLHTLHTHCSLGDPGPGSDWLHEINVVKPSQSTGLGAANSCHLSPLKWWLK